MLVFSHRGYHQTVPENTHEAFRQAIRMGVHGIETDVRLSADGQAVLFHDRLVAGQPVAELTRGELAALAAHEVPALDETLDAFDGIVWNLEIKSREAVDATIRAVRRVGRSRRLLVTSFWHDVVVEVARQTTVDCGLLVCIRPLRLDSVTSDAQRPGIWPDVLVWKYEMVDESLLGEARGRGIRNFVYGTETPQDHKRCVELPLDAVITDRPEFLFDALHAPHPEHAA